MRCLFGNKEKRVLLPRWGQLYFFLKVYCGYDLEYIISASFTFSFYMTTEKNYLTRLQPVIDSSWFTIDEGTYVYALVPEVTHAEKHLMVVRDAEELTVLTETGNLPMINYQQRNKDNWKLLNIRCGNPFYCVGFIAHITGILAEAGIDIVLVSTFSKDLVLVLEADLERAVKVLVDAGFTQQ